MSCWDEMPLSRVLMVVGGDSLDYMSNTCTEEVRPNTQKLGAN